MFLTQLPLVVDPRKLAAQRVQLAGVLELSRLSQLIDYLADAEGRVEVRLDFDLDEKKQPRVQGKIQAEVDLICQRCLETMVWSLQLDFLLGIVRNEEEAKALPDCYDPWLVPGEQASLAELVQEELILGLPLVARHETCASVGDQQILNEQEKPQPFAVLKDLTDRNQDS